MENYHKHTCWSNIVQMDSATTIEEFVKISDEYGCQCYFSGEHGFQGNWLYCYDFVIIQKMKKQEVNLELRMQ